MFEPRLTDVADSLLHLRFIGRAAAILYGFGVRGTGRGIDAALISLRSSKKRGANAVGMYSEVLVLYPVTPKKLRGKIFQSKDLPEDFVGGTYAITEDGRLLFAPNAYESVPERQRPYFGTPEWQNPLFRAIGCLRAIPGRRSPTRYTGTVEFYADRGDGALATYRATFLDGTLSRLAPVRRKAIPNLKHGNGKSSGSRR